MYAHAVVSNRSRRDVSGLAHLVFCLMVGAAACAETPSDVAENEPVLNLPATGISKADLRPEGKVVQTSNGYNVEGTLRVASGDRETTFANANLQVRFDAANRVTSISGQAQIPSPHERITFADPVRAEVGLFSGKYLNEHRDLGIKLKDNTDYFVFDVAVALELRIATGQTGANAVKPVVVRAPVGKRVLMIVDYTDPMYFVYGSHDLIGAAGIGWSSNGRIPFTPTHPVAGLGSFDGKNTRVGTFPVYKVLSVTGQMVDNEYSEVHLADANPFRSLRAGYQSGFNGELSLDLFLKDIAGIEIPIGDGSGGVWADASVQNVIQGHAYAAGKTASVDSWWPTFIPARPIVSLDTKAFLKSNGEFKVGLTGEYGWVLPTGTYTMSGGFELTPSAMTLTGAVRDGDVTLRLTGEVTMQTTTVYVEPPVQLLDAISASVNSTLGKSIADAQKAYDNLVKATKDYEFELSLRGLRSTLPAVVDVVKKALSSNIASELEKHSGKVYYDQLKSQVNAAAAPYYVQLDQMKAAALDIRDNDQTRKTIEAILRDIAGRKIFKLTFEYKALGVVLAKVVVEERIMSDAQAAALIHAADNVKYIKATSDIKISMQQIYDRVPDRAIFEQVRDDVQNGVLVMARIQQLGFVHTNATKTFSVYAIIGGQRYEFGSIDAFSVAALAKALPAAMIKALRAN